MNTTGYDEDPWTSVLRNSGKLLRSVGLLGAYVNGRLASSFVARCVTVLVLSVLCINLFLFLNVALGFCLGATYGGSPATGFLMLAGGYVLLIVLYLVVRTTVERWVRNVVSRRIITLTKGVDRELRLFSNDVENSGATVSSMQGSVGYEELCRLEDKSRLEVTEHLEAVKLDVVYLRDNSLDIVSDALEKRLGDRYPLLGSISTLWDSLSSRRRGHNKREGHRSSVPLLAWGDRLDAMMEYTPIVKIVFQIVRPVLWNFAVMKIQGLLASMLGIGGKGKYRK